MKAVLISIRPEWTRLILSGEKTIEVRKTRPKLETPFKVYIYQTLPKSGDWNDRDGHVIGEFVCDEIIVDKHGENALLFENKGWVPFDVQKKYAPKQILYGWHISALKIYDNPLALSDFIRPCCERVSDCGTCPKFDRENFTCTRMNTITRPAQSWMYVEDGGDFKSK